MNQQILAEKKEVVAKLNDVLKASHTTVVVSYSALSVAEVNQLRIDLKKAGAKLSVHKNTLMKKAVDEDGLSELDDLFKGPSALVTAEEAGDYKHNVTLADGRILMPLIIEWSSSEGNSVSDLLAVMLANGPQTAEAGMKINQNVMTFSELLNYMYRDVSQGDKYGLKTYGMYNLASNWSTPVYDRSYDFTVDPALVADGWNTNFLLDEQLDQLAQELMKDEKDHLEILNKIGEIKGLLLDIFT